MANNFASNITSRVLRQFTKAFEANRVLTKTVNTSTLRGKFTPEFGTTQSVKKPTMYSAESTAAGDVSGSTPSDIVVGSAVATVQNYITVLLEWTNVDEALKMDQMAELINPAAEECVTTLETLLGTYMIGHTGLTQGSPGTAVDAWTDVAGASALMQSLGVPAGEKYYVMNPFDSMNLASTQTGINGAPSTLVQTAWETAQISANFGGLKALTSNHLSTFTAGVAADREGMITSAPPTQTYAASKDTDTMTLVIDEFESAGKISAGDTLEFSTVYYKNPRTGQVPTNNGTPIKFRCTATADATATTGTISVVVTPAAVAEGGAYDNVDSAIIENDVVTVTTATGVSYQPNLFYHKDAFGITTVPIPKLFSTDTVVQTVDGFNIRCSKYATGDTNIQTMRFDLLPVFCTFNPMFAGKGYGS